MIGLPGTFGIESELGLEALGVFFWIGLGVIAFGIAFNLLWSRVLKSGPGVFDRAQFEHVLRRGEVRRARVEVRYDVPRYRRGKVPFMVLQMEVQGGVKATFGTFRATDLQGMSPGKTLDVLWHPDVPGLAIPIRLLER